MVSRAALCYGARAMKENLHRELHMNRAIFLFSSASWLFGCASDHGFTGSNDVAGAGGPQIRVEPEFIDFGALTADQTVADSFTVTNVGDGDLEVEGIELLGSTSSFTILTPEEDLSFVLPGSASAEIEVAFTPLGADEQVAEASITSNDEDSHKVTVELFGEGLVADLQIDPNPYDFGDTYIGCPHSGEIDLINVGYDALTIDSVSMTASETFALLTELPLPMTLQPEEFATVSVEFLPLADIDYTATLTVTHDAPAGVDEGEAYGAGLYAGEFTDTWEIPYDPPVDLIFSVDQSGSMSDDAASLAAQFTSFISQLSDYTTDWHIIVANNDDGCNSGGILTYSTPGYEGTFQYEVQQGGGSYTEKLLTVTSNAVDKTDAGECNSGFMRTDAMLHIIMVSDEPEQSANSWDTYVNQVIAKKGSSSNVKMSAIAGDWPGGCQTAAAGVGYYEASQATNGEFLSICSNWSSMVGTLADASIQMSDYELSHTPDADTIVVTVDGELRYDGWYYEASTNTVIFDQRIPEEGETVNITYSALANCD